MQGICDEMQRLSKKYHLKKCTATKFSLPRLTKESKPFSLRSCLVGKQKILGFVISPSKLDKNNTTMTG